MVDAYKQVAACIWIRLAETDREFAAVFGFDDFKPALVDDGGIGFRLINADGGVVHFLDIHVHVGIGDVGNVGRCGVELHAADGAVGYFHQVIGGNDELAFCIFVEIRDVCGNFSIGYGTVIHGKCFIIGLGLRRERREHGKKQS